MSKQSDLRRGLAVATGVAGVVVVAFAVGGVFMLASGHDPIAAYASMLGYALGTKNGFAEVVVRAIPLTLTGLGVAIAFRAKLWNIGAEGQLYLGALTACAVGTGAITASPFVMVPVVLAAGALAGALLMLVPTLLEKGSEAQKEQYISPTLRGELVWCQGYSEPGAGSDLASIQTRGEFDGDAFVVNGHKIWTSGAHESDMMFALVRTELDDYLFSWLPAGHLVREAV